MEIWRFRAQCLQRVLAASNSAALISMATFDSLVLALASARPEAGGVSDGLLLRPRLTASKTTSRQRLVFCTWDCRGTSRLVGQLALQCSSHVTASTKRTSLAGFHSREPESSNILTISARRNPQSHKNPKHQPRSPVRQSLE